jgi:hypothetical protein
MVKKTPITTVRNNATTRTLMYLATLNKVLLDSRTDFALGLAPGIRDAASIVAFLSKMGG